MPGLCFPTKVEIEFQRTNLALFQPVDVEKLFDLIDEHERDCKEAIRFAEDNAEITAADGRCMSDAILDAVKTLDTVMNDFTLRILDRLNKIDRHQVAEVLKENMDKIREGSEELSKSRK